MKRQGNISAVITILDGIVHQDSHKPSQKGFVAVINNIRINVGSNGFSAAYGKGFKFRNGICNHPAQGNIRKVQRVVFLVHAGECNKLIYKLGHTMALGTDIVQPLVFTKLTLGNIKICKDQRERCFQFVTRIGNELLLLFVTLGNGLYRPF